MDIPAHRRSTEIRINKKAALSPFSLFAGSWILVSLLYVSGLSERLSFDGFHVLALSAGVISLFVLGYGAAAFVFQRCNDFVISISPAFEIRFWRWFWLLVGLSILEFAVCGYVPLLEKLKGTEVSHFEFGISSLHGFLLAGYLFFSTCAVVLWRITGNHAYLAILAATLLWAVLVLSRKLFMVAFLQIGMAYYGVVRFRLRRALAIFGLVAAALLLFGIVGDVRTGGELIDEYGGFETPADSSFSLGSRWAYLYATTPLHNLLHASSSVSPEYNYGFRRTLSPLVPSAIQAAFGQAVWGADRFQRMADERYWIESSIFNVSTAMIGPFIDLGWMGAALFLISVGILSRAVYARSRTLFGYVASIMLGAAAVLSIYSNNYVNLNMLGQILWAVLVFYKPVSSGMGIRMAV